MFNAFFIFLLIFLGTPDPSNCSFFSVFYPAVYNMRDKLRVTQMMDMEQEEGSRTRQGYRPKVLYKNRHSALYIRIIMLAIILGVTGATLALANLK